MSMKEIIYNELFFLLLATSFVNFSFNNPKSVDKKCLFHKIILLYLTVTFSLVQFINVQPGSVSTVHT